MTIKAIKMITVLTLLCTVFVCFGTVCSEAAARPGRVKGFKAKVIGRNVKLSWAKAGGKVSRYVIYRNGRRPTVTKSGRTEKTCAATAGGQS